MTRPRRNEQHVGLVTTEVLLSPHQEFLRTLKHSISVETLRAPRGISDEVKGLIGTIAKLDVGQVLPHRDGEVLSGEESVLTPLRRSAADKEVAPVPFLVGCATPLFGRAVKERQERTSVALARNRNVH